MVSVFNIVFAQSWDFSPINYNAEPKPRNIH